MAAAASAVLRSTVYSVPGGLLPPATKAGALVSSACASAVNCAVFSCATLAGSVHATESRFAACQASQVLVPTTATAFTLPTASAPRLVVAHTLVGTTAITPDGVAGVEASVPPKLGQCLMMAYTMFGRRTSRP
jgi:hypothetical protein